MAVVTAVAAQFDLMRHRGLFYALFAASITASVQLVGVFLVFASLIVPALVGRGGRHPLMMGYGVGVAGYVIGLLLSAQFDLPTGASIVCALAAIGAVVGLCRGRPVFGP